jgi:hypothetical protein
MDLYYYHYIVQCRKDTSYDHFLGNVEKLRSLRVPICINMYLRYLKLYEDAVYMLPSTALSCNLIILFWREWFSVKNNTALLNVRNNTSIQQYELENRDVLY